MDVEPNPSPILTAFRIKQTHFGRTPLHHCSLVTLVFQEERERMEEDERNEAAISSNPCHEPNFKSNGVTQEQLAKFRELRRRRLQMKNKSNNKKKHKDLKGKFLSGDLHTSESPDKNTNQRLNDPSEQNSSSKTNEKNEAPSSHPQAEVHPALKKKKLHWGLDTKERWERKANM